MLQFWSDVLSYLYLSSDSKLTAGASLDLQMKLRVWVSSMQYFELLSLINKAAGVIHAVKKNPMLLYHSFLWNHLFVQSSAVHLTCASVNGCMEWIKN